MRRILAGLAVWMLLTQSALADCPTAYTSAAMAGDLSALGTALRNQEPETFNAAAKRVEAGLVCVERGLPRMVYASAYRYIGMLHFNSGDEANARRWFRTALELEPTFVWDVDELDFSDPLRAVFESERSTTAAQPVPVVGATFVLPEGGEALLDGRPQKVPAATLDRPHLLQIVSSADQSVISTHLIDGNQFPRDLVSAAAQVAAADPGKARKEKKPKGGGDAAQPNVVTDEDGYSIVKVARIRPPAKTPLMIVGGAGVLASGAVYALSFGSRAQFNEATTTDDLLAARTKTNALVLSSGAVLAVGLGVGYIGISLDSGPGWWFGARF